MILAFETSCDDSAVAIMDMTGKLVANEISSQIPFHQQYGGVVPEIASRQHLLTLPLVLRYTLEKNGLTLNDIKAIAVTSAPGLVGSLLVGISYAKTLSWIKNIPLIPVDHLEGHLLAPFLDNPELTFPYLGLIASGGHTHLVVARELGSYQLLGKTIDDAVGEAYDKVAKMLGFHYPGGPVVDKLAAEYLHPDIDFPLPLKGKKVLNFSFSGLKTAVRNEALSRGVYVERRKLLHYDDFMRSEDSPKKRDIMNIASSFQKIVEKIISKRFQQALRMYPHKKIVITGGVAANRGLRKELTKLASNRQIDFYHPQTKNCTDNAAMIAYVALQYIKKGNKNFDNNLKLNASPRSPLGQLELEHSV